MSWLLAEASHIGYSQVRPMATANWFEGPTWNKFSAATAGQKVMSPDCSEMVTLLCRWAGLEDPSGMGYDGFGNSSTMYNHLPHYTNPSKALVGAIVAFGPGGSEHVAMVLQPGPDPVIFSHGSSQGPIRLPLSQYEAAEPQQSPVTLLSIGNL